jgi:hypothetical protein
MRSSRNRFISAAAALVLVGIIGFADAQVSVNVNRGRNPWTGRRSRTAAWRNPWNGHVVGGGAVTLPAAVAPPVVLAPPVVVAPPWTGAQIVNPWTGHTRAAGMVFNPWTGRWEFNTWRGW